MDIEKLKEHAARCRRLAKALTDERAIVVLLEMAAECEVLLAQSSGGSSDQGWGSPDIG
jgi:hypothetical protein